LAYADGRRQGKGGALNHRPFRPVEEGSAVPDEIWPKDAPKADITKLIDFVSGLVTDLKKTPFANDKAVKDAEEVLKTLGHDIAVVEKILAAPLPELHLKDMPESCLVGRLGQICDERLCDLPRAYAWLALLAAGSAFLDSQNSNPPTMLYVALVGPVHSGKTQAIERAIGVLGLEKPQLMRTYSGSAEQLVRRLSDAAGNPRLLHIDELAHLFKKQQIDRASFPQILNEAYYNQKFEVLSGHKPQRVDVDVKLSMIGGIVEELFQDSFAKETVGGQHDRFLFGLCPGNFHFDYAPLEGSPEKFHIAPVKIDRSIWEAKRAYLAKHPQMNPRILETSIRTAVICAAFNGNKTLKGFQLGPAFALAEYQLNIREILQPNTGETVEGKACSKILNYVMRYKGKYLSRRQALRDTHVYDLGPTVADRVISVLKANGDIEVTKIGKQTVIRYILPEEDEPEDTEN
jgi:hypothetical protein